MTSRWSHTMPQSALACRDCVCLSLSLRPRKAQAEARLRLRPVANSAREWSTVPDPACGRRVEGTRVSAPSVDSDRGRSAELAAPVLRTSRLRLKRWMDLVIGVPALIILLPVFVLVAIIIRLDSA